MRVLVAFLTILTGSGMAFAQGNPEVLDRPKPGVAPKPAAPNPPTAVIAPKANPLRETYNAMTAAERTELQSDLIWTGEYNGLVNGEFSDRLVAAVKAFQKRIKAKETGLLNTPERAALAAAAKPLQDEVGWRVVQDPVTGIRFGLPGVLATESAAGPSGTRWTSKQEQLQIETFRDADASLNELFEQQKRGRRITYQVLRPDFFVLSGTQNLKKFYVRAAVRNGDVRGIVILYDQAMEGTMDPVVVAMSSAFTPFPTGDLALSNRPQPRRKVEYATGLVVSADGFIVTSRQAVEGCQVIVAPSLGNAERVADEPANDLALLRVYGARNRKPIGLLGPAPSGVNATLVGIADPQTQGGGDAVTAVAAQLGGAGGRALEPAPALGFSGAAAVDSQGRLFGMVTQPATVVAGPAPSPQAVIVPRETLIKFLDANYVAPSSARAGIEDVKASVVRVICVRK